ncbi:MAG: DMT family transporter [Candidatus Obscuribacterales bacterium]
MNIIKRTPDNKMPMTGVFYALFASVLFGVTTPLAKTLVQDTMPVLLAGLFYLGSGVGLSLYLWFANKNKFSSGGPSLRRADWPWLGGAIFAGGLVAPVLLMLGLASTQASTASLFLNFEGVFTALIAWFVFKENFDKRILLGMLVIVLGGMLLSVNFSTGLALSSGVLLIGGACIGWAVDNNLTRKISNANPAQIACLKGLVAGVTNVVVAFLLGAKVPGALFIVEAMVIGFLGYGVSLVLFVLALRYIGTARTGAYFASAPFVGAIVAIGFLREAITLQFIAAAILMGIGLWLHLTEQHSHEHEHEEMEHEHEHVHDEHHLHEHAPNQPLGEPHVHKHRHTKLRHEHAHFPDLHHNH